MRPKTEFWFVRHGFDWYWNNPGIISWNKEKAKIDKNWNAIERGHKIVYYSPEKPKGLVGLFEVKSDEYEVKGGLRYGVKPLFLPNTKDWRPKELGLIKRLGFNTTLQGTVNKLDVDQYRMIKRLVLGMDEPDNHEGLVALFAKVHFYLGFPTICSIQQAYPDAIVENEHGKEMRVELEYDSDDFRKQEHDPKDCDVIVCWEDGWGRGREHTSSRKLELCVLKSMYGS